MNVLKCSKNGNISLKHFVEHKPLISEEWKSGTFEILCQLTIYLYILDRYEIWNMPEIFSWTKRALEVLCCKLLVLCLHTYLFLWRRIKQRCEPTYFAKNMLILWYRYTYNISENYAFKRFENYCCICVICMKWMNIHEYYMMMYFLEKRFDYAFFFCIFYARLHSM